MDTPGTNAIIRRHEELTRDFVPRADLVLFVTTADRPFTESERGFLEQIREWGKKIVFMVNKIDILATPEERAAGDRVRARARRRRCWARRRAIFAVSAREAQAARADGSAEALGARAASTRWRTICVRTLDQEERVRLKLLNPLNVGLRLAARYKDVAFERLKLLAQDVETIQNIDQQLALFHDEMLRDFEPRLARLDVLLGDMERRGMRFFEETIRIGRIRSLMDSEGVRRAFEREVIGDTPAQIEAEVGRVIDWIVERNLKAWQDVSGYIDRRQIDPAPRGDDRRGGRRASPTTARRCSTRSAGCRARWSGSYDREAEARAIANDVQGTFATTALAQAGALGLGTLVVTVLTGAVADVTGLLLAAALAVSGFYVIPRKRRQAQRDFSRRIAELRTRLRDGLTRQVHLEISPVGRPDQRGHRALPPLRAEHAAGAERGPRRAGRHRGRAAPAPGRDRAVLTSWSGRPSMDDDAGRGRRRRALGAGAPRAGQPSLAGRVPGDRGRPDPDRRRRGADRGPRRRVRGDPPASPPTNFPTCSGSSAAELARWREDAGRTQPLLLDARADVGIPGEPPAGRGARSIRADPASGRRAGGPPTIRSWCTARWAIGARGWQHWLAGRASPTCGIWPAASSSGPTRTGPSFRDGRPTPRSIPTTGGGDCCSSRAFGRRLPTWRRRSRRLDAA